VYQSVLKIHEFHSVSFVHLNVTLVIPEFYFDKLFVVFYHNFSAAGIRFFLLVQPNNQDISVYYNVMTCDHYIKLLYCIFSIVIQCVLLKTINLPMSCKSKHYSCP